MAPASLEKRKTEMVEKIGVFLEKYGYQPIPARILGLLLVTDKPHLTFDEITEQLKVSKSAVSIGINLLLGTQQIDYITLPGDRKRYFKSRITEWREIFKGMTGFANAIRSLLEEILELHPPEVNDVNKSIREVIHLIDIIQKELPQFMLQWDNKLKK